MLNNHDFAQKRRQSLGGSDMGAILGLSPYRSAMNVWLEKTAKDPISQDSLALRFGQFAESFIADEYALVTKQSLNHPSESFTHPQHPYMNGHIDRLVINSANQAIKILECKTANPFRQSDWGELGSDEVPMAYLIQCQWYMMLTGIQEADLAVLFGNTDFRIYNISADQELIELLIHKARDFWENHVLKNIPPEPKSEFDLRQLYPQAKINLKREADIGMMQMIERYHQINQELNTLESKASEIKQNIMSFLGEAEILEYQNKVIATWKSPKASTRLDTQKLIKDHPELTAQYQITSPSSRRLIIKDLS